MSQPETLNNMNVPPPTTIQTTNQLSDLPNTKPLDLMSGDGELLDPNFLKNVPPPNRNLPPPSVSDFLANSPQQQVSPKGLIKSG